MKVYITSNGCAVLKHETERIAKFFHVNSWERIMCVQDADIVVMTCCGVTHNEENQAIEIISMQLDFGEEVDELLEEGLDIYVPPESVEKNKTAEGWPLGNFLCVLGEFYLIYI